MTALKESSGTAVLIGRFQPFHDGHLALLRHALSKAHVCVVVIGSAFQARTAGNPFTWEERAEMIRLAAGEQDAQRLRFVPVRDYFDRQRWIDAIRKGVTAEGAPGPVTLFGHLGDPTADYLRDFDGWILDDPGAQGDASGTAIRDAWFGGNAAPAHLPRAVGEYLQAFAKRPEHAGLAAEWQMMRDEKARWNGSPYPPVLVTVDTVMKCAGHVLLIRRGQMPGKGLRAVPGGFIEQRETVLQSALRELEEETRLTLSHQEVLRALKGTHVCDAPDRSQRGRLITHAHFFDLGDGPLPKVEAADDAAAAAWVPVADLASMEDQFHDDHFHILDHFLGLTVK